MIRIPGEIDRYIRDGKLKISLKKSRKVDSVSFSKVSSNKLGKEGYSKKKQCEPFDDILKEEIKKISSN